MRNLVEPPGRFVSGLHVRTVGTGRPFVVFEAGLAATSAGWSRVQHELKEQATTSSYDRAGLGWSPAASGERTLRRWSDDLHRLIHQVGRTPVVLVGHSFGACIVRVYAHRFPDDVAALVLVDPMIPEEFAEPTFRTRLRLRRVAFFSQMTALLAACGLVRLGLWALLRRGPGDPGPVLGMSSTLRRVAEEVGKLPWDAVDALRVNWRRPGFYRELAAVIKALPVCARETIRQPLPRHVPVIVLSGSHQTPASLERHRALATTHMIVEGSAHWIHLDNPALVAKAILSTVGGKQM
jgi:pimeloyl-ACP methyl ester carboxylesterase